MNSRARLDHLLQTAFTVTSLDHQLQLWRECLDYALYHTVTDIPPAEAAAQYGATLPNTTDRAVVSDWPHDVWGGVQANNFTAVFNDMLAEQSTLSTLVLYVPTMPDEEAIAELGQWCREQCQVDLLDLKIEPAVVGGIGFIDSQQRYQEISLRTKLASDTTLINEVISRYV